MPAANPILDFPLRASRCYGYCLGVCYGMTGVLTVVMPLATPVRLLFLVLWLLMCWRARANWLRLRKVERLRIADAGWLLVVAGRDKDVELGAHLLVTSWLVILPLKLGRTTLRLPVLWDSAAPEDLRRLRVWLNCRVISSRDF